MRFQAAISEDMNDLGEPLRVPGDQNGAVAIQRIFFSAKQGDAMVLKPFLKPLQTFGECGSGSDEIVGNGVFNVALAFIAARTEFPAKENRMNPSGFKRKLKRRSPGYARSASNRHDPCRPFCGGAL